MADQPKRLCHTCGDPYHRRNLIETWTVRNEGHREGWVKRLVRQCLKCQPISSSVQLLKVMHVPVQVNGIGHRRPGGRTGRRLVPHRRSA